MLARSLIVLVAATAVAAWPIAFFDSPDCNSEPVLVLDKPPPPGSCNLLEDYSPVKSYSGGTEDSIQKLLIYFDNDLCHRDAAHRLHSNHTINNSVNKCIPFKKNEEVVRSISFIEEMIPLQNHNGSSSCNRLIVQT